MTSYNNALHYINKAIEDDNAMGNKLTMKEAHWALTEYDNYRYKLSINRMGLEVALYNLHSFDELKDCKNLPSVTNEYTHTRIKHGSWTIKLFDNRIKVEPLYTNILDIPSIPYDRIQAIELDFFTDRTKLVGIWVMLKDSEPLRLLCYDF